MTPDTTNNGRKYSLRLELRTLPFGYNVFTVHKAPKQGSGPPGDLRQLHGGVGGGSLLVCTGILLECGVHTERVHTAHTCIHTYTHTCTCMHVHTRLASLGRLPPQHPRQDGGHLLHRIQGALVLAHVHAIQICENAREGSVPSVANARTDVRALIALSSHIPGTASTETRRRP